MLFCLAIWLFVWSLTCVSIIGPVRAESVFLFTFLGIGLGRAGVGRIAHRSDG
jgi:hypothetical protein